MATPTTMRKFFVGGNWKCNPTSDSEARDLCDALNHLRLPAAIRTEVVVAPPTVFLLEVAKHLRADVSLAAQNVSEYGVGAFTGETAAAQVAQVQGNRVQWAICGHSERRTLCHESDESVAANVRHIMASGQLSVILCVGETLADREAGHTMRTLQRQLEPVIRTLKEHGGGWERLVIAYEPVWAIGTGKVASAAEAQTIHAELRQYLERQTSRETATATRIIYGGSVTELSCDALAALPDVDGFLVGGASLKPKAFARIVASGRVKLAESDVPTLLREVDHLHTQVQTLMAHNRSLQRKMGELAHAVAALPPCDGPKHTDNAPETA